MFEFTDVLFKEVLNIPSLRIKRGAVTSFIGPSGSGKTTILRLLNKMLSPTRGQILFDGQDLSELDSVLHRRTVTMLSQTPILFEGNIKDNLTAGLRFQKRPIPDDGVLTDMLERIRLDKGLNAPAEPLSGGEKQRLVLGRVLLLDSPVYLLDEPSSALDEPTAHAVVDMITQYVKTKGKTLVMVTHSTSIARQFSDVIIQVAHGRIKEDEQHEANH